MKSITIILKVTSKCNLRCPYCYTKHSIKKDEVMDLEVFEKIIQNICLDYDFLNLTFHGGEALLVPLEWYEEAVKIIKRYKSLYNFEYKLSMQSNITLMNEKINNFFSKEKIRVGFSYDGLNNHKTRSNSELIISNKYRYNSVGGCICLITKENVNSIVDEIKHFEDIEVSATFNIIFNTTTGVDYNLNEITKDEILNCYIKAFEYIITKEKTYSDFMFDPFLSKFANKPESFVCSRSYCVSKWLSVHPNGDVYPCGQEWDVDKKYLLGNVKKDDLRDCIESSNFKNFKNNFDNKIKKCKEMKCEVFDICNGGCPGENKANGSNEGAFIENHCYLNKEFYKYIFNFLNSDKRKSIVNKHILKKIGGKIEK